MSDPNTPRDPQDPNEPRRETSGGMRDRNPYTSYIIAGAAVVVLILAVVLFAGTGGDVETTATDPAIEDQDTTLDDQSPALDDDTAAEEPGDPDAALAE